MNCQDEVNRQKEYFAGLQRAAAMPMSEQFKAELDEFMGYDDVSEAAKAALSFWMDVVGPFSNTLAYIVNNRFILEEKELIMNDDSDDDSLMLADEIFRTLKRLNKFTVKSLLSVLETGSIVQERLFQLFLSDNEMGFSDLLLREKCDTTRLARLCRNCWDDAFTGMNMQDDDFPFMLDFLAENLKASGKADDKMVLATVEQLQPSTEQLSEAEDADDETFNESLEQYYADYRQFCESLFRTYLFYYWEWYDDFSFRERKIIEAIIRQPQAKELYARFEAEFQSVETGSEFIPKEPFVLPADFFSIDNQHTDAKEFFYVDAKIRHKGVSAFVTFINYLAEQGYIRDDNQVKALFAYRMTGRNRPQGSLPPIVWQGKNGKPYELIYIVKYFSERGDYAKMRLFFTGPEWPKDCYSSYAQGANSELRRFVEELYG